MLSPRQIPLTERKSLASKLAFLEAVNEASFPFEGPSDTYRLFSQLLTSFVKEQITLDRLQRKNERKSRQPKAPLKALDASLQSAIKQLRATGSYQYVDASDPAKVIIESVAAKIDHMSCQRCTASTAICQGVRATADDDLVSNHGECLAQLRPIFLIAKQAALAFYAAYNNDFRSGPRPDIMMATQHTDSIADEHVIPDLYAGAITDFADKTGERRSETRLKLLIDDKSEFRLNLQSYKAILYIMFHECICHAFHGLFPASSERIQAPPFDGFAEGFMDEVAFEVLKDVVAEVGLGAELKLRSQVLFADSLEVTSAIRYKRTDCDVETVDTNKANLKRGVIAAQTTLMIIERAYQSNRFGPPEEFKDAFYGLAFDLNLRGDIGLSVRTDFVRLMYQYHNLRTFSSKAISDEEAVQAAEIERVITNYLTDRSIDKLAGALQS